MKTKSEFLKLTNCLRAGNVPFEIVATNNLLHVKCEGVKKTFAKHKFSKGYLRFIKSVIEHIEKRHKNNEYENLDYSIRSQNIGYIGVNPLNIGRNVGNVVELDINCAYWNQAHNMGIISDTIFEQGLGVPKNIRLIALGAVAKSVYITKFDGYKFDRPEIRQKETAYVFYNICKQIDQLVFDCADKVQKDYVFYWVDAVFLKKNNKSIRVVNDMVQDAGLHCSVMDLRQIEWSKNKIAVSKDNGDKREFSYDLTNVLPLIQL